MTTTQPRRRGRPGLDPAQARRVLRELTALLRLHDGNCSAVARELDLSASAVHQLRTRKNNPSYATAQRVAKARGIEVTTLLEGSA